MSGKRDDDGKIFRSVLANQKDRTEDFFAYFGQDESVARSLKQSEACVKEAIRKIMMNSAPPYNLFMMADKAGEFRGTARRLLDDGSVAAVDGTNALDPLDLMTTGFYGCAVGFVTSRHRSTPVIRVTETSARYADISFIQNTSKRELASLCEQLDEIQETHSWPTTFREYVEREVAIGCPSPVVLIDGPIFTQNLSTQDAGRSLLDQINNQSAEGRTFIGVIKNISASTTMTKWCGFSLLPGEAFVIQSSGSQLLERYRDSGAVSAWVSKLPDDYVRVVFKPNNKAFGLECRLKDLGLALAIMMEDASPTLNHELPMLIETVDAQIRAGFDSKAAHQIIRGKVQESDLSMGTDITNERDYR